MVNVSFEHSRNENLDTHNRVIKSLETDEHCMQAVSKLVKYFSTGGHERFVASVSLSDNTDKVLCFRPPKTISKVTLLH